MAASKTRSMTTPAGVVRAAVSHVVSLGWPWLCFSGPLFTGRTVRSDTAMTGEISLRGLVLPIGGVKEKVLAAVRAGITRVLLPARTQKDLDDIPESELQARPYRVVR